MFYTDEFIIGLAQRCSRLQRLYFSFLLQGYPVVPVTDAILLALSKHCPYLRVLDVSSFTQLTEDAILQFIPSCKYLRRLQLSFKCLTKLPVLNIPVRVTKTCEGLCLTFSPAVK